MLKTIFKDFSYLPRSIIQYNNKLPFFPTEFINNLQRFQSPQRFIKFPLPNDKKQLKFLYFTTTANFHSFPAEFISNLQRFQLPLRSRERQEKTEAIFRGIVNSTFGARENELNFPWLHGKAFPMFWFFFLRLVGGFRILFLFFLAEEEKVGTDFLWKYTNMPLEI